MFEPARVLTLKKPPHFHAPTLAFWPGGILTLNVPSPFYAFTLASKPGRVLTLKEPPSLSCSHLGMQAGQGESPSFQGLPWPTGGVQGLSGWEGAMSTQVRDS